MKAPPPPKQENPQVMPPLLLAAGTACSNRMQQPHSLAAVHCMTRAQPKATPPPLLDLWGEEALDRHWPIKLPQPLCVELSRQVSPNPENLNEDIIPASFNTWGQFHELLAEI
jgi:hypothetical protein